ncbi:MAG: NAD(P)-dependent oxidoreductase [Treponema sp.]|nr:NAD(P)-dependent oxidoreductase [Treponema sp.]
MIWIIGRGKLGAELSALFSKIWIPHIVSGRNVDITNIKSLMAFVESRKEINWIVNCAACNAADTAGYDSDYCRAVNSGGSANIAKIARKIRAKLIHISADSVFSGEGVYSEDLCGLRPYQESDEADPAGIFGITKRDGEQAVRENSRAFYIIRTAWLYGRYGGNFVDTMLRLMKEQESVFVDNSRRSSPTWTYSLALVIITLIRVSETGRHIPYGIYHYTDDGDITQLEFARKIYALGRELNLLTGDCAINAGTGVELSAGAAQPGYFVLDKKKIRSALRIKIRPWDSSLRSYLECLSGERDTQNIEENDRDSLGQNQKTVFSATEERLENSRFL